MIGAAEIRGATLSDDGAYRFLLWRHWGAHPGRRVLFVMLNPSTADARHDDPTLWRCCGFAQAWGYDGLLVANLYPLRASRPAALTAWLARQRRGAQTDPALDRAVGRNYAALTAAERGAAIVVCAWGAWPYSLGADEEEHIDFCLASVSRFGRRDLHCLGLTAAGAPMHPLARGKHRIPRGQAPVLWRPGRGEDSP